MKKIFKTMAMMMVMTVTLVFGSAVAMAAEATPAPNTTTTNPTSVQDITIKNSGSGEDLKLTIAGINDSTAKKGGAAWADFITKYKNFIVGISGIAAVSMLGFFIFLFMRLGANAGSSKRSEILVGLLWAGVAAAGLGSVAVIVGFFYGSAQ